jgi:ABC-type sulfate/molybdate transport systems ATPase subunit
LEESQLELQVAIQKHLRDFGLEVAFTAGQKTLGILGASGSGKSMTLRSIAGVEPHVKGRILLNGRPLLDSGRGLDLPPQKRRIGFLLQDYALFPHLTVRENVAFGLRHMPRRKALLHVQRHIELVQLEGLQDRYPRELSGGQQQRVALARALATEPEALLLDEPLSALDVHLRSQMEALLIETLASYEGVALYVTHNLEEAYRISEEIVVISHGKQVACGAKEEIFRHPPNLTVARVTGCKNFSRARAVCAGTVEALDWGCQIRVCEPLSPEVEFIGIRAHHLAFTQNRCAPNAFPCTLVRAIEGPFRMTLYLKLLNSQAEPAHHHLQAEITKENWEGLRGTPFPWRVRLDPARIMTLKGEVKS